MSVSRRARTIQWGVVAVVLAVVLAAGCGSPGRDRTVPPEEAPARAPREEGFTPTPLPANEEEAILTRTRSSLVLRRADGTLEAHPLTWRTLYRSGDRIGGGHAGLVVDHRGEPIQEAAGVEGPFHADSPDANTFLEVSSPGPGGPQRFLLTHFEYEPWHGGRDLYARLPMVMNLATLRREPATGLLRVAGLENVDMAAVGGLWIPCAASRTPWNTHLGSEEYEPNARTWEGRPFEPMNLYLGTEGRTAAEGGANPYRYGRIVEVEVEAGGATRVSRRYALGRLSFELAEVMPDGRTVYLADDGRDVVRAMFVADREGDLSAGTLYAARWRQTSAVNGGAADLEWIRLGHATEEEVARWVEEASFSRIFETVAPGAWAEAPETFPGFRAVWVYPGLKERAGLEVLRIRPGWERAAAFLETRRTAGLLGATTELYKIEGQAVDAEARVLYTALSELGGGMPAGGTRRPRDHVRLEGDPADLACGAVYASRLEGGVVDTEGEPIDSTWVAVDMKAVLTGRAAPPGAGPDPCDPALPANPDNLELSPALGVLFIAEDSTRRLHNGLWAWSLEGDRPPVRILTAPPAAEVTGPFWSSGLEGSAYLFLSIQHPGSPRDFREYLRNCRGCSASELRKLLRKVDSRGVVGYLGPMPAVGQ